jgi:hypothetical protein
MLVVEGVVELRERNGATVRTIIGGVPNRRYFASLAEGLEVRVGDRVNVELAEDEVSARLVGLVEAT